MPTDRRCLSVVMKPKTYNLFGLAEPFTTLFHIKYFSDWSLFYSATVLHIKEL